MDLVSHFASQGPLTKRQIVGDLIAHLTQGRIDTYIAEDSRELPDCDNYRLVRRRLPFPDLTGTIVGLSDLTPVAFRTPAPVKQADLDWFNVETGRHVSYEDVIVEFHTRGLVVIHKPATP